MRKLFLLLVLIGTGYSFSSCSKSATSSLPVLSTLPVTNISLTTATSGGNITSEGNSTVTARGVCWSTSSNPSISDSKTSDGNGIGQFTSNLTALIQGTPYYVRAYASNSAGTAYGNEVTFTAGPAQSGNAVTIQGMAFSPQTLTVAVNTTVTWTNNDGVTHTVTSDGAVFASGNVAPGGTFSYQFTSAGTFPYHCSIHNSMTGKVIVQ
jgi:plastocyanin